jgi:hypothetical protein
MVRCIWIGALTAIFGAFLVAPLLALVYKFPIPLHGMNAMKSGIWAAACTPFAVAYYGVLGGFVILGVLEAAAGVIAFKMAGADRSRAWKLSVALGLGADLVAACALFVADLISPGL